MSSKRKQDGKIFISYRRADSSGVAGRLSDSLSTYFGDERVFRDIEDIAGGANFGNVIEQNLQSADAVIVLIGHSWLAITDSKGQRRLDDPDDWVALEIAAALRLGISVYPILIENTPMPREEELPEKLKPLSRCNALSITDKRWKYDVLRLGRVISFDIPSASERKLDLVRAVSSLVLLATLTFAAGIITWNFLHNSTKLLQLWQSGVPFVGIGASTLLLYSIVGLVEESRQRFIYASIWSGAVGGLIFFILMIIFEDTQEPMVTFFGATLVASLMFALMNMSGFKAK